MDIPIHKIWKDGRYFKEIFQKIKMQVLKIQFIRYNNKNYKSVVFDSAKKLIKYTKNLKIMNV